TSGGWALVAGHDVALVDLHLALQPRLRDPGHQTAAQLFGHGLRVGRAQLQLQGDLPVREVQAHEVQAQHPHAQRLVVPGQHCPGEVVETPGARLTPIALPMRLGVVAPVADHRIAAAAGAAHTLAPAMLAHQREALGGVQQGREIDQINGWHDGGGSSHEPVSYSRSRLQARPPLSPAPPSGPHHPERRQEPQFNDRADPLLNRTQYPSDVIALVVLWRLRYKLSLRDLPEMFAVRGIVFSHEAVRGWEA